MASSKSSMSDRGLVLARGQQRRLVHQVGEVGAGETRRPRRHDLEVDVGRELHVLGVDAEDLFAPLHVGLVHQHLAVEAAGAEQGRVEHLGPVGRGHDDDRLASSRSRPSRPATGSASARAPRATAHRALHAGAAKRVELVDEDDARRLRFGL